MFVANRFLSIDSISIFLVLLFCEDSFGSIYGFNLGIFHFTAYLWDESG